MLSLKISRPVAAVGIQLEIGARLVDRRLLLCSVRKAFGGKAAHAAEIISVLCGCMAQTMSPRNPATRAREIQAAIGSPALNSRSPSACYFDPNTRLRTTGSRCVVQVGGDARAKALGLQELAQP